MSDETVTLTADELSALCQEAAERHGYRPEMAQWAGEMVVWLERHGFPGAATLAMILEQTPPHDPEAVAAETLESGEMRFPDALTGGLFLLENFDRLTFPARINGPTYGALLMVPFFALAAHQRNGGIRISFIAREEETVGAQITYAGGKSAFVGEPIAAGYASRLGLEFPVDPENELNAPQDGPFEVDAEFYAALQPTTH